MSKNVKMKGIPGLLKYAEKRRQGNLTPLGYSRAFYKDPMRQRFFVELRQKYEVMVGDTETPPDGLFDEVRAYLEKKAGIGKWIGATGDAEIDATLQDFLADYFSEFAGVVTHYIVTGKVKPVPRATVASVKVIQTPAGPMVLAMGGPLSNHTQIAQDYLELAYRTYGQPKLITERLILDCSETNTEPRFIARRCTP